MDANKVVRSYKLQLHDAIYRLRFYSISLTHILSLSNSHSDVASIQKNRGDKSHRVIVAIQSSTRLLSVKQSLRIFWKMLVIVWIYSIETSFQRLGDILRSVFSIPTKHSPPQRRFILYPIQSASKQGRRTFLKSAIRELVHNGQLWARGLSGSFVVTRSYNKSIFQQQFGESRGDDGCYSIYFDSSTIVRLPGLL